MTVKQRPVKWRKAAFGAIASGVISFAIALWLARLYRSGALGVLDGSELLAGMLGLIFVLIAAQVGVGVAVPGLGTRMLNVEDADDLRDQRVTMACSGAVMGLWGAGLILLALAGPGGPVSPTTALLAALALAAMSAVLTLVVWRHLDELMRGLSTEAGNVTYYLLLIVGGGWALLAHLGFASAPAPLDWLTMLFGLVLVGSFIAVGRRGMLMPR